MAYLVHLGFQVDLHRFQLRFVIGWENNKDGDITLPLSLKAKGGLEWCWSIGDFCLVPQEQIFGGAIS